LKLVVSPAAIIAATVTTVAATAAATITATTVTAAVSTAATAIAAATTTTTIRAAEAAVVAAAATTAVGAATTAATAVTAATAAAAITATAFTGRASFCGAGFVHDYRAATEFLAMHASNGCLGLGIVCHFHEAKTFGAACIALHHDARARHGTKRAEGGLQIVVTHGIRQIAYVQSITHLVFTYQCPHQSGCGTPKIYTKSDGVLSTAKFFELYLLFRHLT
jgi:hypothetical protein